MRRLLVAAVALVSALAVRSAAAAEAPLWTEGAGHGGLAANAPINLQSFAKLARTLGPAVVNIIAIQTGGDERPGNGDKPRRGRIDERRGQGFG